MTEPSAPSGRQVIVVRAGPPKKRGHIVDAIVGIIGVALLVFAGVLGEVLPEEEFVPIQYLPAYPTNSTGTTFILTDELVSQVGAATPLPGSISGFFMHESETVELPFVVDRDNVVSFQIRVLLQSDDIASSLPDTFTFQIKDPEGNLLDNLSPWELSTGASSARDPADVDRDTPANNTAPLYSTEVTDKLNTFRFGAPPEPEFLSGSDGKDIDRVTALRYAVENGTAPTEGTWYLVVSMKSAGDCPAVGPGVTPSADLMQRYTECTRLTDTNTGANTQPDGRNGQDVGNPVTIRSIRYDYYEIEVPEPAE